MDLLVITEYDLHIDGPDISFAFPRILQSPVINQNFVHHATTGFRLAVHITMQVAELSTCFAVVSLRLISGSDSRSNRTSP